MAQRREFASVDVHSFYAGFSEMGESQVASYSPSDANLDFDDKTLKGKYIF